MHPEDPSDTKDWEPAGLGGGWRFSRSFSTEGSAGEREKVKVMKKRTNTYLASAVSEPPTSAVSPLLPSPRGTSDLPADSNG